MTVAGASLLDRLGGIEEEGLSAIEGADDETALEAARVEYLGRNGRLASVMSRIGTVEPAGRRAVGQRANAVKTALREALEQRGARLVAAARRPAAGVDLTLTARGRWVGGVHPVTRVIDEICDIFAELGFTRVLGPEIESTWYNFTALNIPLDHPAADMMDTFYLDDGIVLRTHTSPMQARVMETFAPPVRVMVPGLAYRRDSFDPSHAPAFEQIEGLAVDEGVDFVEFRGAIEHFVRHFFGKGDEEPLPALVLPVHRALRRGGRVMRGVSGGRLSHLQAHRVGDDHGERGWWTRPCSRPSATTRSGTRATRSAWDRPALPWCATASPTCGFCTRGR